MQATQANPDTDDGNNAAVPHERYEQTDRKAYGSQQEVADAWAAGKYPTHNVGSTSRGNAAVLYSGSPSTRRGPKGTGTNFRGYQYDDGSGELMHYSTREAIRTRSGMVISNHQCWSQGFAHCSTPDGYDARLPLDAIEDISDDDALDIREVIGQPVEKEHSHRDGTYLSRPARNSIAVFDGYGVAVGRDPSLNGDSHFVFRLSESEVEQVRDEIAAGKSAPEAVSDAIDAALTPDAVAESDRPVVNSREYTETRLDDREAAAHEAAGGNLTEIERGRYRDDYLGNLQHFRADLQGEAIVRQGEWFFIPRPDADPAEQGTRFAEEQLDNHRAMRSGGARSPTPRECENCGATRWHVETEDPRFGSDFDARFVCKECKTLADRPIYVRGQVRHTENDHDAVNLGETWHEAVSHGREVLVYDDHPAPDRRSGRRTRYD